MENDALDVGAQAGLEACMNADEGCNIYVGMVDLHGDHESHGEEDHLGFVEMD